MHCWNYHKTTTTNINLNSYSSTLWTCIDISMRLMRLIKLTYFMADTMNVSAYRLFFIIIHFINKQILIKLLNLLFNFNINCPKNLSLMWLISVVITATPSTLILITLIIGSTSNGSDFDWSFIRCIYRQT